MGPFPPVMVAARPRRALGRAARAARAIIAISCCAACSAGTVVGGAGMVVGGDDGVGPGITAARTPIELSQHGTMFLLATTLLPQRTRAARLREDAARATGALLPPLVTAAGAPLLAANGTRVRGTCGVTFIAPSYAVTAAHCADATAHDLGALSVEMYRPTPAVEQTFPRAAQLGGIFPGFDHPRLTAADGYLVDRYACQLVSRCSDGFGGAFNCDAADAAGADAALVRCDGAPGAKYGYLDIAAADVASAELYMPWKHEVYDAPLEDPADGRWQHYVAYAGVPPDNYHYFGRDSAGVEQNQLLPLVSADFDDGTPHHKVGDVRETGPVGTNLFGCHGTSGSGVLQPAGAGPWQLLGPVIFGGAETGAYLCDHVQSLDGSPRDPGSPGISYNGLATTKALVARNRAALAADCDPLAGGRAAASLFVHLGCALGGLAAGADNAAFAGRLREAGAFSALDALHGPAAAFGDGDGATLAGFATVAGEHYRLGVDAWPSAGCPSGSCPRLSVSLGGAGGRKLLDGAFDTAPPAPVALAATFVADASGPAVLAFAAGGGALEVGAPSLRREDATNTFDSQPERLEAALIDLADPGGRAQPARFVGDGARGFAALLLPSERLVLTRQALAPGRRWTARFAASPAGTLSCGLVDGDGRVARRIDCSSGLAQLDDTAAPVAARAGFFVESPPGASVTVDDIQIVSDAMPDHDGDGIPDVVDRCPRGPEPPGEPLRLEVAAPPPIAVCAPEPTAVVVPVPRAVNACDPPVLAGTLSAVHGRPLGALGVDVSPGDGRVLLPLGTSTITWEARDRTGNVYATADQTVTVAHAPGPTCCAAGQSPASGTASGDALVLGSTAPGCALVGAGDDLVIAGSGADWLWGDSGGDYLRGGGAGGAASPDVLLGGPGDDYLGGGTGAFTAYGGDGNDTVHARFAVSARLFGGNGADVLVGSEGADQIFPGPGWALVAAGAGDDTVTIYDACELESGTRLDGGAGRDTLVTPVPAEALAQAGLQVTGFETVIVDGAHAYLSECF